MMPFVGAPVGAGALIIALSGYVRHLDPLLIVRRRRRRTGAPEG